MSEVSIDDDVVLWAVNGKRASAEESAEALKTQPLLLLMHGFGSFEGDLIGLAPHLPHGFVVASPRAPLVAPPPIVNGFAWWPLQLSPEGLPIRRPDPEQFEGSGPHVAAIAALAWLDALDARLQSSGHAPGLGTVALMGFSQGGCMVTSLMRLQPQRFACGVNCSGFVAPGSFEGDAKLAEVRPPMFWGRDEADPVITDRHIALTSAWAPDHTALEAKLYPGILHGIGADELIDIHAFLVQHVPESSSAQR